MRKVLAIGVLLLAVAAPAWAQPAGPWGSGPWGPGMGWAWQFGNVRAQLPVTLNTAIAAGEKALVALGNPDLALAEAMEFSNHVYLIVIERSTKIGAFEVLVDKATGQLHPEPGPNMMWNTKYGHMAGRGMMGGGMMGPGYGPGRGAAQGRQLSVDQMKQAARQYLRQYLPGSDVDDGTPFYGYRTFDVERGGKTLGMLSVNAYTGLVWYHTWHGQFIAERELR